MNTRKVAGFFDVNRVSVTEAVELRDKGWVGVLGDPNRVVAWRKTWVECLASWFSAKRDRKNP